MSTKTNAARTLHTSNSKNDSPRPVPVYRPLNRPYQTRGAYDLQNKARTLGFPDGVFYRQFDDDGMFRWYFKEFVSPGCETAKQIHYLGKNLTEALENLDKIKFGAKQ